MKTVVISSRCARTMHSQRLALARSVRSEGWRVVLAGQVDGDGDPFAARLAAEGFPVAGLPVDQKSKNPFSVLGLILAYVRLLRRERPDVFHAFTIKPIVAGLIAAALVRTPRRIGTVAGLGHVFLSTNPVVRTVAKALLAVALRSAHVVIFYNRDDLDLFVRERIVSARRAVLVPGSGVDTDRFAPAPQPDTPPFRFLFIGRLLREKGILELMEAARRLHESDPAIEIACLGDVDTNNPSSLTASDLVGAPWIRWLGATDDVRPHIAAANAVLLPSYREGIPLSLLEAASMARPIIATDAPGCRDVVREGETGYLVPVGDAAALEAAIRRMAADPARATAMGEAARADIVRRFAARAVSAEVLARYRSRS